jgi:hypothetical protein
MPVTQKLCSSEMVYSLAEHVFILEHYFTLKFFATVHEAFSNAYPEKEVPNKTDNRILGHRKCLRQEMCWASDSVYNFSVCTA